jgi:superkiller protein 3
VSGVYLADVNLTSIRTQKLLDCQLAFAYVHVDSPIHHRKALRLLDQVLQTDAENTLALLSKAYILSQAESWSAAMEIFDRLLESVSISEEHKLESRGERAWCLVGLGRLQEAEAELEAVLDILYQQSVDNEDLLESLKEAKGRTWWRLGRCFWERGGASRAVRADGCSA